jgi:hypothetical protein
MEINIDEYLSEEDKREIVVAEFRSLVAKKFATEKDLERILSNTAYSVYYNIVDECFDGKSMALLKENIDKIIENPSSYNVFKKPDAWDREPNSAYRYLQDVIENNKPRIAKKVVGLLDEQTVKTCKEDVVGLINDVLAKHISKF